MSWLIAYLDFQKRHASLSSSQASGMEGAEIPDDVKLMGFAQLSIS